MKWFQVTFTFNHTKWYNAQPKNDKGEAEACDGALQPITHPYSQTVYAQAEGYDQASEAAAGVEFADKQFYDEPTIQPVRADQGITIIVPS
jgi:hypothetical protein